MIMVDNMHAFTALYSSVVATVVHLTIKGEEIFSGRIEGLVIPPNYAAEQIPCLDTETPSAFACIVWRNVWP